LSGLLPLGTSVSAGHALALVHAATDAAAADAVRRVQAAFTVGNTSAAPTPLVLEVVEGIEGVDP
jgi:thymidine phosphorylase